MADCQGEPTSGESGALPAETNAAMEASLGSDFGSANIHNESSEVTDQMDAKSYTLDAEVPFSPEKGLVFDTPSSGALKSNDLSPVVSLRAKMTQTQNGPFSGELVAHELNHVVHQSGGRVNPQK
jgi:hypothetical protein